MSLGARKDYKTPSLVRTASGAIDKKYVLVQQPVLPKGLPPAGPSAVLPVQPQPKPSAAVPAPMDCGSAARPAALPAPSPSALAVLASAAAASGSAAAGSGGTAAAHGPGTLDSPATNHYQYDTDYVSDADGDDGGGQSVPKSLRDPGTDALVKSYLTSHAGLSARAMDFKHAYTTYHQTNQGSSWSANNQTLGFSLVTLPVGNGIQQRLGDKIRLHRVTIRFFFRLIPFDTSPIVLTHIVFPRITIVLLRNKIPDGTTPLVYATTTNNIPNQTRPIMISLNEPILPNSIGDAQISNAIAVANPLSAPLYHIYRMHHLYSRDWYHGAASQVYTGSGYAVRGLPTDRYFEMRVPLHGVESTYNTASSNQPILNDISLLVHCDQGSGADRSFNPQFNLAADLEFEDLVSAI